MATNDMDTRITTPNTRRPDYRAARVPTGTVGDVAKR